MSKHKDKKPAPKKRGEHEKKLVVKGAFLQVMRATVKDARKNRNNSLLTA